MAYRDPEVGRARDRERFQRRTAERIARGLCPKCGERPPEPERSLCAPCAEKRNRACRARDAKLRAAGKRRRDPATARVSGRRHRRRQAAERRARGLCPNCGEAAARARCQPVRTVFRAAARGRPRPLREGQGRRQALWRARPRAAPKDGAREESAALARTPRSGPVHPMRAPAPGRGRRDLRAVP